jgi:hypothetical protein
VRRWTRPESRPLVGLALDHLRSPAALRRENALLRKHLEVACRQIHRPQLRSTDRAFLVLLARLTPRWRDTVLLIHRPGFALLWQRRSRRGRARPPFSQETVALIQRRAHDNALWGAERYFNSARPHQGIRQQVPDGPTPAADVGRRIVEIPVLGGLHHEYRRAA